MMFQTARRKPKVNQGDVPTDRVVAPALDPTGSPGTAWEYQDLIEGLTARVKDLTDKGVAYEDEISQLTDEVRDLEYQLAQAEEDISSLEAGYGSTVDCVVEHFLALSLFDQPDAYARVRFEMTRLGFKL